MGLFPGTRGDDDFHVAPVSDSAHAAAHFVARGAVLEDGGFLSPLQQSQLGRFGFFEADSRGGCQQGSEAFRAALEVGFGVVEEVIVSIFRVVRPFDAVAGEIEFFR